MGMCEAKHCKNGFGLNTSPAYVAYVEHKHVHTEFCPWNSFGIQPSENTSHLIKQITLTGLAIAGRCWSYVGDLQTGQVLSLGPGCDHKAVIEHELLHALGFYHTQSRQDRDDYVKIWLDQVTEGQCVICCVV